MAENKKYYWLKLKEGFFGEKEIKKLRKIAGGDTYTIIYLKLMLLSLRDSGKLYYEGVEETFYEELALEIDEEPDNVKFTLMYLQTTGLLEEVSGTEAFLTRIPECVGSETQKAELMRKKRAREKALNSGNFVTTVLPPVTNCYPEIEIERDKDKDIDIDRTPESSIPTPAPAKKPTKHKYGQYSRVLLTDEEYSKLIKEYGYDICSEAITFLDEYIEEKGYKSKSHNLAIRRWVVNAVKERAGKKLNSGSRSGRANELNDFYNMAANFGFGEDE